MFHLLALQNEITAKTRRGGPPYAPLVMIDKLLSSRVRVLPAGGRKGHKAEPLKKWHHGRSCFALLAHDRSGSMLCEVTASCSVVLATQIEFALTGFRGGFSQRLLGHPSAASEPAGPD